MIEKYLEIVKIISGNDEDVLNMVTECVTNPMKFFEEHNEPFRNRLMDKYDSIDIITWIGVLDILIEAGYIIEEDWKADLYTFVDDVSSFKLMHDVGIEIDEDLDCLNEDEDIASWARALETDPVMQGYLIGGYDIGADCYDFFVCTKEELETLSKLAEEVGHRICRCSEC